MSILTDRGDGVTKPNDRSPREDAILNSTRDENGRADASVLVACAQAGDQAAFSRLVQPHMRKIYHVALRITRNREDAEDASQQTLLKAFANIGQFHGASQFSTWLIRIAMNEALMAIRKRRSEDSHLVTTTQAANQLFFKISVPLIPRSLKSCTSRVKIAGCLGRPSAAFAERFEWWFACWAWRSIKVRTPRRS